jgi:hypothetical protein
VRGGDPRAAHRHGSRRRLENPMTAASNGGEMRQDQSEDEAKRNEEEGHTAAGVRSIQQRRGEGKTRAQATRSRSDATARS